MTGQGVKGTGCYVTGVLGAGNAVLHKERHVVCAYTQLDYFRVAVLKLWVQDPPGAHVPILVVCKTDRKLGYVHQGLNKLLLVGSTAAQSPLQPCLKISLQFLEPLRRLRITALEVEVPSGAPRQWCFSPLFFPCISKC